MGSVYINRGSHDGCLSKLLGDAMISHPVYPRPRVRGDTELPAPIRRLGDYREICMAIPLNYNALDGEWIF
jgi:hypothetical protein